MYRQIFLLYKHIYVLKIVKLCKCWQVYLVFICVFLANIKQEVKIECLFKAKGLQKSMSITHSICG